MKQYVLAAAGLAPRFGRIKTADEVPEIEILVFETYQWVSILRPVYWAVEVPWRLPYITQTDEGMMKVIPKYAMPVVQGIMALDFDPMRVNGAN